jgi:predicted acyltransferase
MKSAGTTPSTLPPQRNRIDSIDIVRGLTILVMIFVNDVAGVTGTPPWMHHMPSSADGMTFVDLVFSSFLFIVGMSVPFAIGRRLDKDTSYLPVIKHVIIRTFGLVLIGVFMVNSETINENGIINPHVWSLLLYLSVFVIWSKSDKYKWLTGKTAKASGIIILVLLFIFYRGNDASGLIQMRHQWWGILGLIGWSYLISVLLYIPFRKNNTALIGCIVILYCFYMATNAGMNIPIPYIDEIYGFTSLSAIVMSGILLGTAIDKFSKDGDYKNLLKWGAGYGVFLFLAGFLLHQLNRLHPMFIISKDYATAPWCLFSSAIITCVWIIIFWFADVKKHSTHFSFLQFAGRNALLVYILPPIFIEPVHIANMLTGLPDIYNIWGETFSIGLFRSLFMAFAMTWIAGWFSKKQLHLKL